MRVSSLVLRLVYCSFFFLPVILHSQYFSCDGTSLPSFYSLYGGSSNFTQHTNDAIQTFIEVEEAISNEEFVRAKSVINELFDTYPKGSNIWYNVFNDPMGANLGTPHAYYGIRMLEDIVDYHLDPAENPVVKTAHMKVVLVGCSEGVQPRTQQELNNGGGVFVTNELDQSLIADDYCLIEQSLDMFLDYVSAISNGELEVEVEYVVLPNVCMDVSVNRTPPLRATGSIGPVWAAMDDEAKNNTDWFWIIYPSHVPEFPDFDDDAFITGGMGADSKGGPAFIIDDKWLVRKPAHLGNGMYNDIERRIYLPQWLQHEFYHHLYRIYPEFSLEVNGHDWFNRSFWPADFVGQFEPDYYAESLYKRLQDACVPLSTKLITRNAEQVDLTPSMVMDELLGAYSLDNIGNPWHEAVIIEENGRYFWRNSANVRWQVTPNLEEAILETGADCPYPGQNFKIELFRNANGDIVPGSIGLVFLGELYRKRFDLLREEAPFEIMLADYETSCLDSELGRGSIIKEMGQFYWQNDTGSRWPLSLDSDEEALLLGANSPSPGAPLQIILSEETCGLSVVGFEYQNHYHWLPKINTDNLSPSVLTPLDDVNLDENFNTYTIDISNVFADMEGDPLRYFASSEAPSLLEVGIDGGNLVLEGGTAGVFEICVMAIDDNRGRATSTFVVHVGEVLSVGENVFPDLDVFPNPVDEVLYLRNVPVDINVTLYNSNASIHKSFIQFDPEDAMDVGDLPTGVYFVKIEDAKTGTFIVKKIFKK